VDKGENRAVASLIKPPSIAKTAAQEVRLVSLPVIALGVMIAILYFGRVFFITAMTAVTIAFILEPFVTVLMRLRLPRSVASFFVCTLALLFLYVMALGAYTQLTGIYGELPKYGQRIADIVDGVQQKIQGLESDTYRMLVPTRQRLEEEERQKLAKKSRTSRAQPPALPTPAAPPPSLAGSAISDYIGAHLNSFYQFLLMASFIPFLVYFMLSWRDHINRSFLQLFQGEARGVAARSLEGIAEMVRAFVVGNFLLGFLLGVVSSAMFYAMQLPYPFLVGPLSGLLSLVPYVGLPLAMAPPLFAALGPNRVPTYVLVVVSVSLLHLIALNLLYPKVVGSRVHLNPLAVTFSLMLWGFLWDAPGLLLAIPLTAGLKAVCDNVKELRPIGKFLGD
jgi:predicted PurR-regulated permease PerM